MTDPFIFENEFQKLKQILALTSGNKLKLHYVLNYIEPLLHNKERFIVAAYLEELLPYLTLVFKIDFTGTNLSFLLRLKNLLEALCLFSPVYSESREIKYSIDHLNSESEKIKHWLDNKKVDRNLEFSNIKINKWWNNIQLGKIFPQEAVLSISWKVPGSGQPGYNQPVPVGSDHLL